MQRIYTLLLISIAIGFTLFFAVTVIPPLLASGDVAAALAAGFVNPYAAGYSTDVILCWVILALWVMTEARSTEIQYGWVCVVLGAVPGVAVGFSCYLLLRQRYLRTD